MPVTKKNKRGSRAITSVLEHNAQAMLDVNNKVNGANGRAISLNVEYLDLPDLEILYTL